MTLRTKIRILAILGCSIIGLGGCATPGINAPMPTDVPTLQSLAEHGNAIAANDLGVLYSSGTKVPQDFAEARKWYLFANDHGNPAGAFNLGIAYQKGQGTPVDHAEALKWFLQAADHDFAPANYVLAVMYRNGVNVPRDPVEAARLARSAALQGLPTAQGYVAALYLDGDGVPEDDSLAYQWASLAASKMTGVPAAAAVGMRDSAARGLNPAELAAAQSAAVAWKPGVNFVSLFPPGSGPRPPRLRGSGSGFVVGKDGEIGTAFHVVPNCREIKLTDPAGAGTVTTRLIAGDKANDVAVLAGGGFGTRLKIRTSPPALGETISAYGFPLSPVLSSTGNLTSGSVTSITGMAGNARSFQISAPVQIGSSGGPVVDESGAVVGIVASKLNALAVAAVTGDLAQNVNFAWRTGPLTTLMDANGVAYEKAAKAGAHADDLAGLLQKATVKIECWR